MSTRRPAMSITISRRTQARQCLTSARSATLLFMYITDLYPVNTFFVDRSFLDRRTHVVRLDTRSSLHFEGVGACRRERGQVWHFHKNERDADCCKRGSCIRRYLVLRSLSHICRSSMFHFTSPRQRSPAASTAFVLI